MTVRGSSTLTGHRPMYRVALATLVGTTLETYDFVLYAQAAALVFGTVYFTRLSPASGTLAAFATFAAAFVVRPVGAVLFGHFGDRIGRRSMLIVALVLSGVATVGVGVLPGYGSIGLFAPAILVLLRLLQGVGPGGEWPGAVLLAVEHAPADRACFRWVTGACDPRGRADHAGRPDAARGRPGAVRARRTRLLPRRVPAPCRWRSWCPAR